MVKNNQIHLLDELDLTSSAAYRAGRIASELQRNMDRLSDRLAQEHDFLNSASPVEYISDESREMTDEVYSRIRCAAYYLYKIACEMPDNGSVFGSVASDECQHSRAVVEDQVQAYLEPDAIYVRTPMLWSRQNKVVRSGAFQKIGPERCTMYQDSVRHAIMLAPNFGEYDFTRYREKMLHYLFVFNGSLRDGRRFIDNDNHETKHVTDGIVSFLPGGDAPLCCRFFYDAILENRIPEGSYITVLPQTAQILSPRKIVKFWMENGQKRIPDVARDIGRE